MYDCESLKCGVLHVQARLAESVEDLEAAEKKIESADEKCKNLVGPKPSPFFLLLLISLRSSEDSVMLTCTSIPASVGLYLV